VTPDGISCSEVSLSGRLYLQNTRRDPSALNVVPTLIVSAQPRDIPQLGEWLLQWNRGSHDGFAFLNNIERRAERGASTPCQRF